MNPRTQSYKSSPGGDTNSSIFQDIDTSGSLSVRVGAQAGKINTGTGNALVGYQAGQNMSGTQYTTAIGYQAGMQTTNALNNTYVGAYAGAQNNSSENVFIGYQSGQFSTNASQTVGIGAYAMYQNTTGNSSVAVGYRAGERTLDGGYNTMIGAEAGQDNRSGNFNTMAGYQSGRSAFLGNENTYFGAFSGYSNSHGSANCFIGYRTGYSLGYGDMNIAIGAYAMQGVTGGSSNVVIGPFAQSGSNIGGGNYNTILGINAGQNNSGNNNTLIGANIASNLQNGNNNTLIGANLGQTLQSGDYNILIGTGADVVYTHTSNAISIGSSNVLSADHDVSIGEQITNKGYYSTLIGNNIETNVSKSVVLGNELNIHSDKIFHDFLYQPNVFQTINDGIRKFGISNINYTNTLVGLDGTVYPNAKAYYTTGFYSLTTETSNNYTDSLLYPFIFKNQGTYDLIYNLKYYFKNNPSYNNDIFNWTINHGLFITQYTPDLITSIAPGYTYNTFSNLINTENFQNVKTINTIVDNLFKQNMSNNTSNYNIIQNTIPTNISFDLTSNINATYNFQIDSNTLIKCNIDTINTNIYNYVPVPYFINDSNNSNIYISSIFANTYSTSFVYDDTNVLLSGSNFINYIEPIYSPFDNTYDYTLVNPNKLLTTHSFPMTISYSNIYLIFDSVNNYYNTNKLVVTNLVNESPSLDTYATSVRINSNITYPIYIFKFILPPFVSSNQLSNVINNQTISSNLTLTLTIMSNQLYNLAFKNNTLYSINLLDNTNITSNGLFNWNVTYPYNYGNFVSNIPLGINLNTTIGIGQYTNFNYYQYYQYYYPNKLPSYGVLNYPIYTNVPLPLYNTDSYVFTTSINSTGYLTYGDVINDAYAYYDLINLSGNGNTVLIGNNNSATLYNYNNGILSDPYQFNIASPPFGLALSYDGTVVAIGGISYFKIYNYDNATNNWVTTTINVTRATILALSGDGKTIVFGDVYNGAILQSFKYINGSWNTNTFYSITDSAYTVSLNYDGTIAICGNPTINGYDGFAGIYQFINNQWQFIQSLTSTAGSGIGAYFGTSVAINANGTVAVVGTPQGNTTGYAAVYTYSNGIWSNPTELINNTGQTANFGYSVNISYDGIIVYVSAPTGISVYGACYTYSGGSDGIWNLTELYLTKTPENGSYIHQDYPYNRNLNVSAMSGDGNTVITLYCAYQYLNINVFTNLINTNIQRLTYTPYIESANISSIDTFTIQPVTQFYDDNLNIYGIPSICNIPINIIPNLNNNLPTYSNILVRKNKILSQSNIINIGQCNITPFTSQDLFITPYLNNQYSQYINIQITSFDSNLLLIDTILPQQPQTYTSNQCLQLNNAGTPLTFSYSRFTCNYINLGFSNVATNPDQISYNPFTFNILRTTDSVILNTNSINFTYYNVNTSITNNVINPINNYTFYITQIGNSNTSNFISSNLISDLNTLNITYSTQTQIVIQDNIQLNNQNNSQVITKGVFIDTSKNSIINQIPIILSSNIRYIPFTPDATSNMFDSIINENLNIQYLLPNTNTLSISYPLIIKNYIAPFIPLVVDPTRNMSNTLSISCIVPTDLLPLSEGLRNDGYYWTNMLPVPTITSNLITNNTNITNYSNITGITSAISYDGNTIILYTIGNYSAGYVSIYTSNLSTGNWNNPINLTSNNIILSQVYSVAISGDGKTAIVGEPYYNMNGCVLIYSSNSDGSWSNTAQLINPTNDSPYTSVVSGSSRFGNAVALNYDGTIAIVSAPSATCNIMKTDQMGTLYYYTYSGFAGIYTSNIADGTWNPPIQLINDLSIYSIMSYQFNYNSFGESVDIDSNGIIAIVSAYNTTGDYNGYGYAAIYTSNNDGTWSNPIVLYNPITNYGTPFGSIVKLSGDGKTALISAYGRVFFYTADIYTNQWYDNTSYTIEFKDSTSNINFGNSIAITFGNSIAINNNGSRVIIASQDAFYNGTYYVFSGYVSIYDQNINTGGWYNGVIINNPYDYGNFGYSLSLSGNGNNLVVNATNMNNIYNVTDFILLINIVSLEFIPTYTYGSSNVLVPYQTTFPLQSNILQLYLTNSNTNQYQNYNNIPNTLIVQSFAYTSAISFTDDGITPLPFNVLPKPYAIKCLQANNIDLNSILNNKVIINNIQTVNNIYFCISQHPNNGLILFTDTGNPGTLFTYNDIITNRVVYQHIGNDQYIDTFVIKIATTPFDISFNELTVYVIIDPSPIVTQTTQDTICYSYSNDLFGDVHTLKNNIVMSCNTNFITNDTIYIIPYAYDNINLVKYNNLLNVDVTTYSSYSNIQSNLTYNNITNILNISSNADLFIPYAMSNEFVNSNCNISISNIIYYDNQSNLIIPFNLLSNSLYHCNVSILYINIPPFTLNSNISILTYSDILNNYIGYIPINLYLYYDFDLNANVLYNNAINLYFIVGSSLLLSNVSHYTHNYLSEYLLPSFNNIAACYQSVYNYQYQSVINELYTRRIITYPSQSYIQTITYDFDLSNPNYSNILNTNVGISFQVSPYYALYFTNRNSNYVNFLHTFEFSLKCTDNNNTNLLNIDFTDKDITIKTPKFYYYYNYSNSIYNPLFIYNTVAQVKFLAGYDKTNDASSLIIYPDIDNNPNISNEILLSNNIHISLSNIQQIQLYTDLSSASNNHNLRPVDNLPYVASNTGGDLNLLYDIENVFTEIDFYNFQITALPDITLIQNVNLSNHNLSLGKSLNVTGVDNICLGNTFNIVGDGSIIVGNYVGSANNNIYQSILIGNYSFGNQFITNTIALGSYILQNVQNTIFNYEIQSRFFSQNPVLIGNNINSFEYIININNVYLYTTEKVGNENLLSQASNVNKIYLGNNDEQVLIGYTSNVDASGNNYTTIIPGNSSLLINGTTTTNNLIVNATTILGGDTYIHNEIKTQGPYLMPSFSNANNILLWLNNLINTYYGSDKMQPFWCATTANLYYDIINISNNIVPDSPYYSSSILIPDGRVIFTPFFSKSVGIFNTYNNSFNTVTNINYPNGVGDYFGSVLLPNGNVLFVPFNVNNVGIYDINQNIISINTNINGSTNLIYSNNGASFIGGVLLSNGMVLFIPYQSSRLVIFDPVQNILNDITENSVVPFNNTKSFKYSGGVLLPDGRVIFVPANVNTIGIFQLIDPIALIYTFTEQQFNSLGLNINIANNSLFRGGILLFDGTVLFIPCNSKTIGIYNPTNNTYNPIITNLTSYLPNEAFSGGISLPDGRVIFVPFNMPSIAIYDFANKIFTVPNATLVQFGNSFIYKSIANVFTPNGTGDYSSGVLLPDGRIIFTPMYNSNVGVILGNNIPLPKEFCLHPFFNKF